MKELITIATLFTSITALAVGEGQLLYDENGALLYNLRGHLIYKYQQPAEGTIHFWCDFNDDLDICGHFNNPSSANCLGWSWQSGFTETLTKDGVSIQNSCSWTGDVTHGGIEQITITITSATAVSGLSYSIHSNYYSTESPVAVVWHAADGYGNVISATVTPSSRDEQKAETSDPSVTFYFNSNGRLTTTN